MSTEVNPTTGQCVDLLGPTVELLTSPQEASIDFCLLRGVIPPGVSVPLHSHPDTEDFFVISGGYRRSGKAHRATNGLWQKRGITRTCPAVHTMAGATFPASLWSHSSSRQENWHNSFRRWDDRWRAHLNQ